jgi:hypothetical protein
MSDPYRVNRSYILHLLKWLGVYLGISIGLSLLIPFPMSFIAFLGVFIVIQFVRRYLGSGINQYGGFFGQPSSVLGFKPLKYYCMSCGQQHNQKACPKCGSKMKRVG